MNTTLAPVGVVTGLASETRIVEHLIADVLPAGGPKPLVACAGASSRRAATLAKELVENGVRALLSFGIGGGLEPGRGPGELVLAEEVVPPQGLPFPTDGAWRHAVSTAGAAAQIAFVIGRLAGSSHMVATPGEKQALFAKTGAAAVDMESHSVAVAAAAANVPFLALRAITDAAERALPHAILGAIAADGEPRSLALCLRLALRPQEIGQVNALRRDTKVAHAALRRLTPVAGALFGGV